MNRRFHPANGLYAPLLQQSALRPFLGRLNARQCAVEKSSRVSGGRSPPEADGVYTVLGPLSYVFSIGAPIATRLYI